MRARRTNTANRAPNMLMYHGYVLYRFARFPSCGIVTPTRASKNYELQQQGDGAGNTSRTTNYELQGTG